MSLKGIIKKIGSKEAKIQYSMYNLNLNPNSPLFCEHCKTKLGLLRMLKQALFKKPGFKYMVKCRNCNNINFRVKGEIGKQFDRDWDKHGF